MADGSSGEARLDAALIDERVARLLLGRVVEPGDAVLARLLDATDAVAVVAALRAGVLPDLLAEAVREGAARGPACAALARRQPVLTSRLDRADPDDDLRRGAAVGAHFVTPGEFGWPTQLDDLGAERPIGLWIRGRLDLRPAAIRSVGVVGSRHCSAYGQDVAGTLAGDLAAAGWLVVSGAAYGIDAAAHRGALAIGGPTAAVLACGVDMCYPRGNRALLDAIGDNGAIIAELPPGTSPNRFRFVERNRLIAALTKGTVIVEAALRSGSLITARRAEALNRHVMGVPGSVFGGFADGVHQLIRDGATLVTDAAEIIEQVGDIGGDLAPARRGQDRPRDALDPVAARVLDALPQRGAPLLVVARETGLDPGTVHAALGRLTAEGWVDQDGEGWRPVTTRHEGHRGHTRPRGDEKGG